MKLVINGQTVEVPSGGSNFPSGGIIIWSGSADNIPTGWVLCDGQNDTPDLRDRFVLGAGTSHAAGSVGGEEEVTLTVDQMPEHTHVPMLRSTQTSSGLYQYASSTTGTVSYTSIDHSAVVKQTGASVRNVVTSTAGGDQPHPNMPPYYALCYIMKL